MNWKRATEKVPENGEETLIRSKGIFELAVYNENEQVFVTKNGNRYRLNDQLLWSGLEKNLAGKAR